MKITAELPDVINRDQVAAAIKALGIPDEVRLLSVHMDVHVVDVRGITPEGTEYSHRYPIVAAPPKDVAL